MDWTPRTDEEIIACVNEIEKDDFFGFTRSYLIEFLPFEKAHSFLRDKNSYGPDGNSWVAQPRSFEAIKARISQYLIFAWDKANNCRGLSAARSLDHMKAWLWMLREDEAAQAISEYDMYGKNQLRAISEAIGFDWAAVDNDEWTNDEGSIGTTADLVRPLNIQFVYLKPT